MVTIVKSDNTAHVGLHCFERANLGKAPFQFIGYSEAKFQAHPGAPVRAGASCDYCGQSIMGVCHIQGADGRKFKVGCDCVRKTGDAGIIRAYKTHPEVRAANRAKARAKDETIKAEWAALMADEAVRTKLGSVSIKNSRGIDEPWLTYAERAWAYCGASGRTRYLKAAKKLLTV